MQLRAWLLLHLASPASLLPLLASSVFRYVMMFDPAWTPLPSVSIDPEKVTLHPSSSIPPSSIHVLESAWHAEASQDESVVPPFARNFADVVRVELPWA